MIRRQIRMDDRTTLTAALPDDDRLPATDHLAVSFLDPASIDQLEIEETLREELADGAQGSPVAAVVVRGRPVSFCYAGAITERWWDVAVDTIESERGRGYAGLAVAHLIHHSRAQGRAPVWQALEDNPASWRLALKLGFTQIDDLVQLIR